MSTELLIKQIARVALEHGYLHLGHCTLAEFIGQELDISNDELNRVEQYLNDLLKEQTT